MSITTDLAKAVVVELNAHEFSQKFEAVYSVKPGYELAELDTLRVIVVPKTLEIEAISRSSAKYVVSIDIGVMQRLGTMTPEEAVATLGSLVDEIGDFLRKRELSEYSVAQCIGIVNEPIYVPEHLTAQRTFTSVLNVKYVMLGD